MQYAYSDIIDRARPVHDGDVFSRRHPRMARQNRAKQYAPFAALTGFEREIKAREVLYEPRRALSAEEVGRLNAVLAAIFAPQLSRGVDPVNRLLRIGDRAIDFKNLYRIEQLKAGS